MKYNVDVYLIIGELMLGVQEAMHGSERYTLIQKLGEHWSWEWGLQVLTMQLHMLMIQLPAPPPPSTDYKISELVLLMTSHTAYSGKGKEFEPETVSATMWKRPRPYISF